MGGHLGLRCPLKAWLFSRLKALFHKVTAHWAVMDVKATSSGALEGLSSARGPLWYLHILFYSLDDGANVQEVLTEISNQRTVPNIFVNKVHVGGCDRTFQVMMVIRHAPQHCVSTL